MLVLIFTVWVLQGLLMFFDEFYFHHKRGLHRWESIGHPVDTFFFLLCFLFTLIYPFTSDNLITFVILSIISTLIITKDEWVHAKEADGLEHWLHSLLFIVHPISLTLLYFAWRQSLQLLIVVQSIIVFTFFIYQIFYWNFYKRESIETPN
jgi:hypothetical protein